MNKQIRYPKKRSEVEIQAILWYFLRKKKVDARLEVIGDIENGKKCIFDIVIFKNKVPVCIVECKSWSNSYILNQKYRKAHNTKQIKKYESLFGLPVIVCGHMKQIAHVQSEVLK